MTSCKSRVPSGNLSEVAATADSCCTNGCTSEPPKRRKRGADAASAGRAEATAEVKPAPVETDFTAALKMLSLLPLSDAEKAEAVRLWLSAGSGRKDFIR